MKKRKSQPKPKKPLSHTRLEISFAELIALHGVRSMLAGGMPLHKLPRGHRYLEVEDYSAPEHRFNMGVGCKINAHCGSVGCIGGYMSMALCGSEQEHQSVGVARDIISNHAARYVSRHDGRKITNLFFPPDEVHYDKITPEQAIQAIDNFLMTGKPRWLEIKDIPLLDRRDSY